jgi:hypothetical protein
MTTSATCSLVATTELVEKMNPTATVRNTPHSKPGIMSAPFSVNPADCKTTFGRWLAERVRTTRRDDDMSRLSITLRKTEAEIALQAFAESLTGLSVRDADHMAAALRKIEAWVAQQRQTAQAYEDHLFTHRIVHFDWPVLGSRAAESIEDPAKYFDLCAARIRALRPQAVRLWDGQEPPESLQVCS